MIRVDLILAFALGAEVPIILALVPPAAAAYPTLRGLTFTQ